MSIHRSTRIALVVVLPCLAGPLSAAGTITFSAERIRIGQAPTMGQLLVDVVSAARPLTVAVRGIAD